MTTTPKDPAATLANALPKDPDDHGPIAVPSDAVRDVLAEMAARDTHGSKPVTPAEHYELAERLLADHSGPEGDALWEGQPPADVVMAQVHATLANATAPPVVARYACTFCPVDERPVYSRWRDYADHVAAAHPGKEALW